LSMAGFNGVCWANSGGEVVSLELDNYIAVDGIHNVIDVLEEIENDKLKDVEFVEALACTGGCVGGPLTVENNFVAKTRLKTIARSAKGSNIPDNIPDINPIWQVPVYSRPQTQLDSNMSVAMKKLARIEELDSELPGLDCGSCGAPSCRALAEDIVRGEAKETDCIIRFKERIARLTNEMLSAQSEE
ncbi:MAG: ferredoxin, partial [Clostridia bacterium]|nr:ferredoxin [Clostridia bacterium]